MPYMGRQRHTTGWSLHAQQGKTAGLLRFKDLAQDLSRKSYFSLQIRLRRYMEMSQTHGNQNWRQIAAVDVGFPSSRDKKARDGDRFQA